MAKTYLQKLKDPRWQKKRLEIMNRDEFMCMNCADTESTLNVHHISYNGSNPWETNSELLITLCEPCHKKETSDLIIAENILIKGLKDKGFLSNDFLLLSELINNMPLLHTVDVQLSALDLFLNENNVSVLINRFFNHLREKNANS